jgi:beta-phosphoglucomutase
LGAQQLGMPTAACVVFEDAEAGLQAARNAGMYAVGIGDPQDLPSADIVLPGLHAVKLDDLFQFYNGLDVSPGSTPCAASIRRT